MFLPMGLLGKREEGKVARELVFHPARGPGLKLSYPLPPAVLRFWASSIDGETLACPAAAHCLGHS